MISIDRRSVLKAMLLSIGFPAPALSQTADSRSVYKERRVALILENTDYQKIPGLVGTQGEAAALAKKFREMNFTTTTHVRNLTQERMYKALYEFKAIARSADIAVLYYTGHGYELGGLNYLLPVDLEPTDHDSIQYLAVPGTFAVGAVAEAKKLGFLMLDACRNDPFLTKFKVPGDVKQYERGLAPFPQSAQANLLIQYAAGVGQPSVDTEKGGPYARALIKHIAERGLSVVKLVQNVALEVTTATNNTQRPYLSGSPISDVFLVPPLDAAPAIAVSPIVVDMQLAENKDEAVQKVVQIGPQGDFEYAFRDEKTRIVPDLVYFETSENSERPFIESEFMGYYSPEEGGTLGIAYPILDIVARRATDKVVTVASLIIDVEASSPDKTPYVKAISPSDQFGTIVIVNEGWVEIENLRFEYDIFNPEKGGEVDVEDLLKRKKDGGYQFVINTGPFKESAELFFEDGLKQVLKDYAFLKFAFSNPPEWDDNGNKKKPKVAGAPAGYAQWIKSNPNVFGSEDAKEEKDMCFVVGRAIITSKDKSKKASVVDLAGYVAIYSPDGLGGGYAEYNLTQPIKLRTKSGPYQVSKSIGYILDQDTKTFRGLFPLITEQSSDHRLRVKLRGDGDKDLFVSNWIDAKILVPKTSKKYITQNFKKSLSKI